MGARETFEQAAQAARRLAMVTAEQEALDAEWKRGEWLGVGSSHAGHSDPTAARACYRALRRDELGEERAELEAVVIEAQELARGVRELLGGSYAYALLYRYLENRRWAEVAELLGVCEKTAYNRVSVALDTIDALGPQRTKQAQGMATA